MPRDQPPSDVHDALSSSAPIEPPAPARHPFATPEAARYLPTDLLGRGGMGRVTAVLDRRLGREVARKDVPPDAPDAASLERRLEREAWVTARLDHPGIVPVHDAGTDPAGHPYFTMRFIRGRSLAAALAANDLARGTLVRHFLSVCQAVAHAHSRGVVHRDLKPDNVMLGPHGETQVVDWGVARVLDAPTDRDPVADHPHLSRDLDADPHTVAGARVGTRAWMSPEQARGEPAGPASDVFALGLVLDAIARRGPRDPELAAIVARATAHAPAARYPDAAALASDLAAYLDGRRVSAFSYSPLDLARRFYRAFRAPILVAAIALVALLVVLVVAYTSTRREKDLAEAAEARAETALRLSQERYAILLVERAIDAWQKGARAEAELLAAASLTWRPSPEARAILSLQAPSAELVGASASPICLERRLSPDARTLACLDAETLSLWSFPPTVGPTGRTDRTGQTAQPGDTAPTLEWARPSRWDSLGWIGADHLVVYGRAGTELVDAATSTVLPSPRNFTAARALATAEHTLADTGDALYVVDRDAATATLVDAPRRLPWAIAASGRRALTYDEDARRPELIDLATAAHHPLDLAFDDDGPMSAALDRDGLHAAFGTPKGRLVTVDLTTGAAHTLELTTRPLTHVTFSPDGRWLATRDERGFVTVVARADTTQIIALPRVPVDELAWRDGGLVTLGTELLTWRLPEHPRPFAYRATAGIAALAVDDAHLALADGLGAVSLFALDSGVRTDLLAPAAPGVAKDVAFSSARAAPALAITWPGRYLTSLWRPPAAPVPAPSATNYRRLVVLADGALVAATYGKGLDYFASAASAPRPIALDGSPIDLVASPDSRTWAALTSNGALHLGHDAAVSRVIAAAPDAVALALGAHEQLAYVTPRVLVRVDPLTGLGTPYLPPPPEAHLAAVALSADGTLVAVGTLEGRVLVWRDGPEPLLVIDGRAHGQRVSDLAFTGRDTLLSASWDGTALRWHPTAPPPALAALERRHGFGLAHATHADLR